MEGRQASVLNGSMLATGAANFLMIGHSNGGLISRRVGQNGSGAAGSLVTGVVTIGSPHQGVPLAHNSRQIVNEQLTSHLRRVIDRIGGSCGRQEFAWICEKLKEVLLGLIPKVTDFAFDAAVPMTRDVRPGSAFLADLNTEPEGFRRYSIEVHSGGWKFMRMFGDFICDPGQNCDGQSLANASKSAYAGVKACGGWFGRLINRGIADKCHSVRLAMRGLNHRYNSLTMGRDRDSDGLVPSASQRYPGVLEENRRVYLNARVSHVGELKSETVRNYLFDLMDRHKVVTQ